MWLKLHMCDLFNYHIMSWKKIVSNWFGTKLFSILIYQLKMVDMALKFDHRQPHMSLLLDSLFTNFDRAIKIKVKKQYSVMIMSQIN